MMSLDFLAKCVKEVRNDVELEPQLLSLTGETFRHRSANRQPDARADLRVRGFWSDSQNAFFDTRVFYPHANGIPTRVRKTTVRTTPVRSQQCECQQCERVNSANANSANATAVRMPVVRMRQQCERRFSELCKTVSSVETT